MALLLTDKKITIRLSVQVEAQIKWWINNIDNSCHLSTYLTLISIYILLQVFHVGVSLMVCPLSRGLWYKAELEHINILGLKAIQLEIYTCCKNKDFLHVSVVCDNVTAISYVNSMGAIRSQTCNNVASRIWDFCTKN